MMAGLFQVVLLAAGIQSALPVPQPTIHDMYVSCYLYMRRDAVDDGKPYSFQTCTGAIFTAILLEGPKQGVICLPKTAAVDADVPMAMAGAYVDFYQHGVDRLADTDYAGDGKTAFLAAQSIAFPCPTSASSPTSPAQ